MRTKIILTIAILGLLNVCFAQQNTLERWEWLMGEWTGEGKGQPGDGSGTFSFSTDLDGKILVRKSHSEYPSKDNRQTLIHDDLMIIYFDSPGNPGKAIYFDNEGHTINYMITYSDKSIIFTSEKIPDAPLFRLTYTKFDSETVSTKFEISMDGVNFKTYIEGNSKKKI
jgi:hypothetical protein